MVGGGAAVLEGESLTLVCMCVIAFIYLEQSVLFSEHDTTYVNQNYQENK